VLNPNQEIKTAYDLLKPKNGNEFFFSNVLIKVYQIPMLFTRSSEEIENPEECSFIVLIFEKSTRKRTFAKTLN
jgi:hypothetical protein